MLNWWLLSLISSFGSALYIGMNKGFQIKGNDLVFVSSVFSFFFLLPFFLTEQPETNLIFIMLSLLAGVFTAVIDGVIFSASRTFGGASVSRILSARVLVVFIFWSIIDPDSLLVYIDKPVVLVALLFALILCPFSLYKAHDGTAVSGSVVLKMLPVLLIIPVYVYVTKMALTDSGNIAQIVTFSSIVALTKIVVTAPTFFYKMEKNIMSSSSMLKAYFFAGLSMGLASTVMNTSRFWALIDAPNPAYVYVVVMLSVFWLYLAHKIFRIEDSRNSFWEFGVFVSALIIILIS